jgi:hypothetical protein
VLLYSLHTFEIQLLNWRRFGVLRDIDSEITGSRRHREAAKQGENSNPQEVQPQVHSM